MKLVLEEPAIIEHYQLGIATGVMEDGRYKLAGGSFAVGPNETGVAGTTVVDKRHEDQNARRSTGGKVEAVAARPTTRLRVPLHECALVVLPTPPLSPAHRLTGSPG